MPKYGQRKRELMEALSIYINLPDGSFECEMCGTGIG